VAKPLFLDMSTKYGGRTICLTVFVNSDEPIHEVLARVEKAGRGQQRNAVAAMGKAIEGAEGAKLWAELRHRAEQTAADPRAVDVDEDLEPVRENVEPAGLVMKVKVDS
jgi:hypothetical protein